MTTTDDMTFSEAAAALAMTPATFSAFAKRKGIVGRKSPRHRHAKLISRGELERSIGYQLTDAQIATAKQTGGHSAKQYPTMPNELNIDFGWVQFGFELANDKWQRLLLAHGIYNIETPPFEPEMAANTATRSLFTRSEMYAMLESCVKQRDRQWSDWVNDSVHRAQFPNGPDTLDFKYPDPEEE